MVVTEVPARTFAHRGELMRERNRIKAAAEEYAKAHKLVGDKYESVSNKYALALMELKRLDEAEQVLRGSLRVHPGSPSTSVHLGRILLLRKDFPKAKQAYLEALAADPFDPEIHVALMRIHGALGESALVTRTKAASVVLTGLEPEDVERVSKDFLQEESGQVKEGQLEPEGTAPKAPAKDGGSASPSGK